MTQIETITRRMRLDRDSVGQGYFEHAVYNHWDPYEDVHQSDIETDRERMIEDGDLTEDNKLTRRIEIITDGDAEIPDVETLVELDDGSGPAAADD